MTNKKEAIEIIKIQKESYKNNPSIVVADELYEAMDMAIKALEQQPCEDCISREEAIKQCGFGMTDLLIADCLRRLPSVTPQQPRWIPVSERLPKENEHIGNVWKYYLIQDEYGDMHVAHLSNVGWIPMDSLKAIGDEVIAWQPLPQPYKAESEE